MNQIARQVWWNRKTKISYFPPTHWYRSTRIHDVIKHQTHYEPISQANVQLKAARAQLNASPSVSNADILAGNLLIDRPLINLAGCNNYDTESVFNKQK
jgi:hypothetical protein